MILDPTKMEITLDPLMVMFLLMMINDDFLMFLDPSWMIVYNGKVLASTRGNFLRTSKDDENVLNLDSLVRNLIYMSLHLEEDLCGSFDDLKILLLV